MKTTFYLIRHGESVANAQNRLCGHADFDLTERGREQAKKTAELFREIPVDAVLSSDLLRAYHTAQALGLPVETDPGFREIFVGPWEGQLEEDIKAKEPEILAGWRQALKEVPGGESVQELYDRVKAALDRAAERYAGKNVVIATHATPIRVLTCVLSGKPLSEAVHIQPVSNASVTKITWDGACYRLEAAQDDHLGQLATRTLNTI